MKLVLLLTFFATSFGTPKFEVSKNNSIDSTSSYPCHPAGDIYPCTHPMHSAGDIYPCTHYNAWGYRIHPAGDIGPCTHPMHSAGDIGPCTHVCW